MKGHSLSTPIQASNDVLPSQFFRSSSLLQPEKRLMLAVLEEAVQTFQRYAAEPGTRAQRLFAETAAWFASDDCSAAFSFVSICQALDFEPSYLRTGLRRLPHADHRLVRDAGETVGGYGRRALPDDAGRISIRVQPDLG